MKATILFFLLILSVPSISQVSQEWARRYNGPASSSDESRYVKVDLSGNVYITGISTGSGSSHDFFTVKYNSAGDIIWQKRHNGTGNGQDLVQGLAIDILGNVYVTGSANNAGSGTDYTTIKYNSTGATQWVQNYNGPGNGDDVAFDITVDASGSVYITGQSTGSGSGDDYATIKYNSSGVQQWVQRYSGPVSGYDGGFGIASDDAGNVYVTGESILTGTNTDFATIKYNSAGVMQWVNRYNGIGNGMDGSFSIFVDAARNVYVTGRSYGGSIQNFDIVTIKYGPTGVQQWLKRYNGPANDWDEALSVAADESGNVYITGWSVGTGSGTDYATIKYSPAGVQQWIQIYNGTGNTHDKASVLVIDDESSVYVSGYSTGTTSNRDYTTIKYNSSGAQQWEMKYNGPANNVDEAISIAVDTSGNVYVTGGSTGSGTFSDFYTIKYSQPIGIQQISSEIPESFSLMQNYPNPFNPVTNISFTLPEREFVSLVVFDITGKVITELVNNELPAGGYNVDFNASHLSSGTYFYRLSSGSFTDVKKMILVK